MVVPFSRTRFLVSLLFFVFFSLIPYLYINRYLVFMEYIAVAVLLLFFVLMSVLDLFGGLSSDDSQFEKKSDARSKSYATEESSEFFRNELLGKILGYYTSFNFTCCCFIYDIFSRFTKANESKYA